MVVGCGRSGSNNEVGGDVATSATQAASGDFGSLQGVCGPGTPTGSPAQGVTAQNINVGVFTDVGFTKNPEFVDAAKVFTSWCNDAGGINGRKLVATTRDSRIFQVQQRMLESCDEDFAIVGGGAAFDGTGVEDRLSCLLPAFPAQAVEVANIGSDLQVETSGGGHSYNPYVPYQRWLLTEAYPDSASSVGIIAGDLPLTKTIAAELAEGLSATGATITYNDLYPPVGVSDWTPYAQAIKNKRVRGLVFLGDYRDLAKLEQVLTTIDYKPDWIDANSNAYSPAFLELLGTSAAAQNNLADLGGTYPLERASANPATQQVLDLFAKYEPTAKVTLPVLRAFSAWLVFAESAASCSDTVTRRCVYDAARTQTAWTGGGLTAPIDLSGADTPLACFNVEQLTPSGWQPAAFQPNDGAYRCGDAPYRLTSDYGRPTTLADVGKSLSDLT
ncbi:ABC transporter substrate-binding protein [Frankia sp. Mgl5]|nr:ABC transporter substrate-binding protein [Frankia sp. Mgl5]